MTVNQQDDLEVFSSCGFLFRINFCWINFYLEFIFEDFRDFLEAFFGQ